jgi:hypothetical protein
MGDKSFLILNCWQSHAECIRFAEISLNKCPTHRTEAWGTAHCLQYMLGITLVGKAQHVLPKNITVMKSWKDIQGGAHTFPTLKKLTTMNCGWNLQTCKECIFFGSTFRACLNSERIFCTFCWLASNNAHACNSHIKSHLKLNPLRSCRGETPIFFGG